MSSSFTYTHRKLLLSPNITITTTTTNPTIQTCLYFCNILKNDSAVPPSKLFCPTPCLNICPSTCQYPLLPPNNYPIEPNNIPHHNLSPLLITMLILLASCFLIITFYTLYTKLYSHFYHFTLTNTPTPNTSPDEDPRGNMVFHPIWYIPTVGLNPTVVNSIKVYKYEKDGLFIPSDCVVCLGEFLSGDEFKILPICNHSFHVHCIDTWLMSHVTCPLCRAPVDTGHDLSCGQTCQVSTTTITIRDGRIIMDDDHQLPPEEIVNNNNNNNNNKKERVSKENKGSSSERWTWERGPGSLVSRSLSCSGKIFSSRYNNRPNSGS